MSEERAALLARYRQLVLRDLPRLAREGHWVVTNDHCFGRIVLDATVDGCWYDVLDRRRSPAFEQLDDEALARAVVLADWQPDARTTRVGGPPCCSPSARGAPRSPSPLR